MLGMNIITSSIPPFHGYGRCEQIFTLLFSSVCEESLPRPNILFPPHMLPALPTRVVLGQERLETVLMEPSSTVLNKA